MEFEADASIPAAFLVGSISGLLLKYEDRLTRLFDGKVYGITSAHGRWFVFRQADIDGFIVGQVVSFRLRNGEVDDVRIEISGLDREVHQIDFYDDVLYITDTYNNRIWTYQLTTQGVGSRAAAFLRGRLRRAPGQMPENYVHLNSIFATPTGGYAVYHNQTRKTGKPSELVRLNERLAETEHWTLPASCAHNVVPTPDGFAYCDSFGRRLMVGENAVFQGPCYLRGLAVSSDFVLVGGSDLAERNERDQTIAYLFMLDRNSGTLEATWMIPSAGSIYEIRLVDPTDLAMSQHHPGAAALGPLLGREGAQGLTSPATSSEGADTAR